MLLKFVAHIILLACLMSPLKAKALRRRDCYECEEEEWEEVPCEKTAANVTDPTSRPLQVSAKAKHINHQAGESAPSLAASHSSTSSPDFTTPKDPYKKCYFECKHGCKEFCRKVVSNPYDKQIVQVSKISEPANRGHIQSTHILQRELIPNSHQTYDNYGPALEPIYGPRASVDDLPSFHPYSSSSDEYNFPIPFEAVFSKMSKSMLNPAQGIQISLDAPSGKVTKHLKSSYATAIPVNDSPLSGSLDDSMDAFIREFIGNNPNTNEMHAKPLYSVPHKRE